MLSIGTIEILLGAGLVSILLLVLVALRTAALRLIRHDDDRAASDRELSNLAKHAIPGHRRATTEGTSTKSAPANALCDQRSRHDRAA